MGLPPSKLSITANSLARSCISLAILKMYLPLSLPDNFDQDINALLAASTALSISLSVASAILAIFLLFDGLKVSK